MFNKDFGRGFVFAAIVVAVCGVAYLYFGMAEVRADIPPSRFETYLMRIAVKASVVRRARELTNPEPITDDNLIAGAKFYFGACAGCHGTPGKPFAGKGPILYPAIPELPVSGTAFSESQIFWIAKHGIRRSGMFANGNWASDKDLWTVAAYIRRMNSLPPTVQIAVNKLAEGQH